MRDKVARLFCVSDMGLSRQSQTGAPLRLFVAAAVSPREHLHSVSRCGGLDYRTSYQLQCHREGEDAERVLLLPTASDQPVPPQRQRSAYHVCLPFRKLSVVLIIFVLFSLISWF